MRGSNVPSVNAALKTFKRTPNLTTLRSMGAQLHTHFGLTLALGSTRTLHATKQTLVQQQLEVLGISPSSLKDVLESVVTWFKTHDRTDDWTLDVRDLRAVAAKSINLGRDLHQLAQLDQLLSTAATYHELGIDVTLAGHSIAAKPNGAGVKADLLVSLRALLGPRRVGINALLVAIDTYLDTEGTYPIEELLQRIPTAEA